MDKNISPELKTLLDKIRRERGFDGTQYKPAYLKRRLAVRLRARGMSSYSEYMALLDEDPAEYEHLLQALSINLSYFFRDPEVYRAVRRQVLRPLLERRMREGRRMVRIWSAGCASGEEPYSLAILLCELLRDDLPRWHVRIWGTDRDATVLEQARQARFNAMQLKDTPPQYVARYFTYNGEYHLDPRIQAMVTFREHDLLRDPPLKRVDLIFCRNVLIYFTRQQHDRIYRSFHQALLSGGHLVLGKTEILMSPALALFEPVDMRERIYRKRG